MSDLKEGTAEWADEMGRAGHKVRMVGFSWYVTYQEGKGWVLDDGSCWRCLTYQKGKGWSRYNKDSAVSPLWHTDHRWELVVGEDERGGGPVK